MSVTVKCHKIVSTTCIDITSGVGKMAEPTALQKRLLALKTVINTELASRGAAIIDLAYNSEKNLYHYTVPSCYGRSEYPVIEEVVERHCSKSSPAAD